QGELSSYISILLMLVYIAYSGRQTVSTLFREITRRYASGKPTVEVMSTLTLVILVGYKLRRGHLMVNALPQQMSTMWYRYGMLLTVIAATSIVAIPDRMRMVYFL